MVAAEKVGISPASAFCILTKHLGKRKISAKWTPHAMNDGQHAIQVVKQTFPM
jgi:hypothetical protein